MMESDAKAPLLDHLIELRRRLMISAGAVLVGFLVCYTFAEHLFAFLAQPLRDVMGPEAKMIITAPHEAFFTFIKVSFYGGLFLALPVALTQLWLFVAPGLYQHERKTIFPFLLITPLLFFLGGAMAYYVVFPFAFTFFIGLISNEAIDTLFTMREYLDVVIQMVFAFGLTFELPVGLLLLIKAGVITTQSLVNKRKYAIVAAFVVGAILTPPDPFSQVMLAVPLLAMYEISILWGRVMERKARERAEADAETLHQPPPE
ncbi:MAG: twin-arginine translocase subunit TatC [Magnetococcales bacterium]|nr:twin-arginine translocase subunit TatC [Magnetococcales bacterium]